MTKCLVCEGTELKKISTMVSPYLPRLVRGVGICSGCGHIQLNPLFTHEEYMKVNQKFFGSLYTLGDKQNSTNPQKMQKVTDALKPYLVPGARVLDVGAGEGWARKAFVAHGCEYFAIESVPHLAQGLRDQGVTVVGQSLWDEYPEYHGYFDVIIFRHVLEHLPDPRRALFQLSKLMRGVLYLALPNSARPTPKAGFRTDFLRPVHLSYFCLGNVLRLAATQSLAPAASPTADGEIAVVLRKDDSVKTNTSNENYFPIQKKVFSDLNRKFLMRDLKQSFFFLARKAKNTFKGQQA